MEEMDVSESQQEIKSKAKASEADNSVADISEDFDNTKVANARFGKRAKGKRDSGNMKAGDSCGNDGDTWDIEEGGCTYTIRETCKRGTDLVCYCSTAVIGEDCGDEAETETSNGGFGF